MRKSWKTSLASCTTSLSSNVGFLPQVSGDLMEDIIIIDERVVDRGIGPSKIGKVITKALAPVNRVF